MLSGMPIARLVPRLAVRGGREDAASTLLGEHPSLAPACTPGGTAMLTPARRVPPGAVVLVSSPPATPPHRRVPWAGFGIAASSPSPSPAVPKGSADPLVTLNILLLLLMNC